eukprot:GHVO01015911.1.p1 GENE.GHVO01015911.1~~GHVO01015911.1.p1  ORF type:complete len:135 (-),score=23.55 GHVO01015911.1:198-602(-)
MNGATEVWAAGAKPTRKKDQGLVMRVLTRLDESVMMVVVTMSLLVLCHTFLYYNGVIGPAAAAHKAHVLVEPQRHAITDESDQKGSTIADSNTSRSLSDQTMDTPLIGTGDNDDDSHELMTQMTQMTTAAENSL